MTKHRKTFRAFNGVEAFDEPMTKDAGDYVGRHRDENSDYEQTGALRADE